ncbi:hypothetical protein E4U15_003574 [Claviceps sp. LM218 group G6]|nr:hypothetical protein E4U15_003574 [Claviceps sp. LM218 group G6]
MPTQHVAPEADEQLGQVAKAMLKARKVVVVTGAGISTNSGIPDFRSENGLYSLIQAQFEAASRQNRQSEQSDDIREPDRTGPMTRQAKRRKLSEGVLKEGDHNCMTVPTSTINVRDTIAVDIEPTLSRFLGTCDKPWSKNATNMMATRSITRANNVAKRCSGTPEPTETTRLLAAKQTSPLSSLFSAPFDSFVSRSPSGSSSRDSRSTISSSSSSPTSPSPPSSQADGDDQELPASQCSSSGGKSALPHMKGRDLFDANIWSDPVRTSVFYTFATSLRQKIRTAEPTTSHRFIRHLRDRGTLVRCYTQNIDQFEEKVGLSTRLQDGPGLRARFSRRSTAATTSQLSQLPEEACRDSKDQKSSPESSRQPADSATDSSASLQQPQDVTTDTSGDGSRTRRKGGLKPQLPRSGVECVFLHGSLHLLRCFLCSRVCSWDETRELETLSGQQPECPHCVGATVAREERGKRALGVGKLRPDIVLYGEEHPSSHLISPIVTHDLSLSPDMLLILGTSLRVHGLKVMVREFAKAVHSRGGKVVFVNLTEPPKSVWGDMIDYWVQWDCDAWVEDLQVRIPGLWHEPEGPKQKKKTDCSGTSEGSEKEDGENEDDKEKENEMDKRDENKDTEETNGTEGKERKGEKDKREKKGNKEVNEKKVKKAKTTKTTTEKKTKPPAANPVAMRDSRVTGAYWTCKILGELHRITGHPEEKVAKPPRSSASIRRASTSATTSTCPTAQPRELESSGTTSIVSPATASATTRPQASKAKPKRCRKSAPGQLDRPRQTRSQSRNSTPTPTPNGDRSRQTEANSAPPAPVIVAVSPKSRTVASAPPPSSTSSILDSVKEHARIRKRRVIDGEEVPAPSVGTRRPAAKATATMSRNDLTLAPIQSSSRWAPTHLPPLYGKPCAMEPRHEPPSGPLSSLSTNVRGGAAASGSGLGSGSGSIKVFGEPQAFYHRDGLVHMLRETPEWAREHIWAGDLGDWNEVGGAADGESGRGQEGGGQEGGGQEREGGLRNRFGGMFVSGVLPACEREGGSLEGELMDWGSSWRCRE